MDQRPRLRGASKSQLQEDVQSLTQNYNQPCETPPVVKDGVPAAPWRSKAQGSSPSDLPVRPNLLHASSTTAVSPRVTGCDPTPVLSKPLVNRSTTASSTLHPQVQREPVSNEPERPSFFRRATDKISSMFEIKAEHCNAYRNRPEEPTYWLNHIHQTALLRTWDAVQPAADASEYEKSIDAQVLSAKKRMLEEFPILERGEATLTIEWMEYVLGICMRFPFCTSEKMGRRQILAAGAGPRGNWGPW